LTLLVNENITASGRIPDEGRTVKRILYNKGFEWLFVWIMIFTLPSNGCVFNMERPAGLQEGKKVGES